MATHRGAVWTARRRRLGTPSTTATEAPVIWHVVRFDTSDLDEETRRTLVDRLAGLASLDVVAWLRVARDIEDPAVVGLLTVFADADDLAAYRVHPDHASVLGLIRDLELPTMRLDIPTDDDPATLP
jgi:hypothetical protein